MNEENELWKLEIGRQWQNTEDDDCYHNEDTILGLYQIHFPRDMKYQQLMFLLPFRDTLLDSGKTVVRNNNSFNYSKLPLLKYINLRTMNLNSKL